MFGSTGSKRKGETGNFVRHKPEKVGNARVAGGHIGLVSRRNHAEMMGGTFEIEAKSGNGTRARVHVPL